MYNLNGKVALVIGAASKPGFGHAVAVRLAKEGADVVVADKFLPPDGLSEDDHIEGWQGILSVAGEIEALGRKALVVRADITDSKQVQNMVDEALKKLGKIDIMVNTAGIMELRKPIIEFDEQVWNQVISINLTGTFLCAKYTAKAMVERKQGGKIINFSSPAGKKGTNELGAYVASKWGIVGLTQTLALELAPYKINVNAVCPGAAATNIGVGRNIRSEARRLGVSIEEATIRAYDWLLPYIPLGRITTVDDVANVVAFLSSSESDYMTGLAISISGGQIML
jgi:meso-butanediol dehydrogenase/(S,S)-butanediol dehydrogenase/diacetyl reductase